MQTIYDQHPEHDLTQHAVVEPLGEHIHVSRIDRKFEEAFSSRAIGPPTLCIAIFTDGDGQMGFVGEDLAPIGPGTTLLFHTNRETEGVQKMSAGSHLRCIDLRFDVALLADHGIASLDHLMSLCESNHSSHDGLLLRRTTSPTLSRIASEISGCTVEGPARQFLLQSRALEALASVLAWQPASNLSAADQRKVEEAIRTLDRDFADPWTLQSLARAVGLNEKKLKMGFRSLARSSMRQYLEAVRMRSACEMIQAGSSVAETAWGVGYSSRSHFTTRFKARFGVSPSQFAKRA